MDQTRKLQNSHSIAILGYGREGRAAIEYATEHLGIKPESLTVLDTGLPNRPENLDARIGFVGGINAFLNLSWYDTLLKSPGIPPHTLPTSEDYDRSTTLAQLFFDLDPDRVIVVSGTRGKSTLATLLARVIADAGYSCPLLGNIGTPPLPAYDPSNPPDYAVIELSSYMLDRLEKRNFISILTNIFPDHLDWHGSMEAYVAAKLRVIRGSDHAFVSAQVAQCGYLQKYAQLYGELPSHEVFGAGGRYGYSDGCWMRDGKELFSSERMKIIWSHVFENFASIIAIADRIGIPLDSVRKTFESFEGLPYRLRYVDTVRGVEFWDDAHSPTPESAIASMRTLSESGRHIGTMLLGGLDRGYDYRALGEAVRDLGVRRCVLFPDAGTAIKKHLPEDVETLETRSMEEAVRWAAETNSGACLLSAAAPSYSIWRNFEEKWDRFIEAVRQLESH